MSYELGVDLGTTFSTVAIVRHGHGDGGGRVEMVDVGTRSFGVPSVLYIGPDGRVLVGEAAQRRAASDPDLVVREVKRRLGDTAPLLVGEVPYSPTLLTGALLRGVVSQVLRAEGEAPTRIMLAHPANWGPFRRDVFAEAASLAGLEVTFEFVTEPVAAALWHAHQERVAPGTVVAVYDLGGGTFDAAVLRKTERGFELLGEPLGLDRLGGIDFDEAIVGFVDSCLGGALRALDPSSDASARTMRAVRQEVVAAKEALSTDIAASISVPLPSGLDAVRITRREFEAMVEPQIRQSIEVMRAAIELAGVGLDQISNVLLVGGSSRIPLVAELLQRELEVSVALDSHPKNVVALGAALALLPNPEADEPTTSPPAVPPSTDHPAPPAASVAASAPAVQAAPQATVFARPPAPSASPTETFLGDVLVVATGPSGGAIIELSDADELVVGRDAAADLTLADPRVSRRHGRLFSDAGLLQLEDLGSLNHSYLDGVAVSRSVVAPGQLLRFGNSLMMAMRPESVSSLIEAGNALIAEPSMLPEPASSGGRLRRHRDNPERYRAVLNERRTDLARQAALVAAARRLQEPTAAMSLVGSRPRRDRGDSRFLHLTLGFADAPTAAPLSIPDGMGAEHRAAAESLIEEFSLDRAVPVVVDLAAGAELQLIGPTDVVLAMVRHMLAQLAVQQRAGDVALALVSSEQTGPSMDIDPAELARVPHLRNDAGELMAGTAAQLAAVLRNLTPERPLVLLGIEQEIDTLRHLGVGPPPIATVGIVTGAAYQAPTPAGSTVALRIDAVDALATVEAGPNARQLMEPFSHGPILPCTVAVEHLGRLLAAAR